MREIIICKQDEIGGWSGSITLSEEERFGIYATEEEALKRAQEQLDSMKARREEVGRKARAYDSMGEYDEGEDEDESEVERLRAALMVLTDCVDNFVDETEGAEETGYASDPWGAKREQRYQDMKNACQSAKGVMG